MQLNITDPDDEEEILRLGKTEQINSNSNYVHDLKTKSNINQQSINIKKTSLNNFEKKLSPNSINLQKIFKSPVKKNFLLTQRFNLTNGVISNTNSSILNKTVDPSSLLNSSHNNSLNITNRRKLSLQQGSIISPTKKIKITNNNKIIKTTKKINNKKTIEKNFKKLSLSTQIFLKNINDNCVTGRNYNSLALKSPPKNNISIQTQTATESDLHLNSELENQFGKRKKFVDINTNTMSVYDYPRPQQMENNTNNIVGIVGGLGGNSALSANYNLRSNNKINHSNLIVEDNSITNNQNNYFNNTNLSMATLCNIGNTCYLNSVVYTLRFAPLFLHNLHHLIEDLCQINQKIGQNRAKSSSLGRNVGGLVGQNARSWSSKDLASLGNNLGCDIPKTNRQIATEKLHELYQNLHRNEITETPEPFHADTFLHSIQEVSSIFEGNHQQDAHEFLMCILDSIRETCQSLTKAISDSPDIIVNGYVSVPEQSEISPAPQQSTKTSFFSRKSKKKEEKAKNPKGPDSPLKESSKDNTEHIDSVQLPRINNVNSLSNEDYNSHDRDKIIEKIKKLGLDFFTEDFEGITVSTTTCLSCETITEQKETMIDIAVPISGSENIESMEKPDLFFQNSCITKEYFRHENKYRCEECFGYTEAIRSISFEVLPRLLVLQLKRFSGGMEKINSYIPTPLQLNCFCAKCCISSDSDKRHKYRLYSVITHVGATMSVGHYIAYTCSLDLYSEYINCPKDKKLQQTRTNPPNLIQSTNNQTNEKNSGFVKKIMFGRSKASSSGDMTKNIKNLNLNSVINKLTNGGEKTTSIISPSPSSNASMCNGLSCCGIHAESILLRNNIGSNVLNGGNTVLIDGVGDNYNISNNYSDNHNHHQHHHFPNNSNRYYNHESSRHNEPIWYMCDDDKIKVMSQTEFEELLSPNNKATITPYLLFYARINND